MNKNKAIGIIGGIIGGGALTIGAQKLKKKVDTKKDQTKETDKEVNEDK